MSNKELKAGAYTAVINPERGANCISLRNSEYDAVILREPDEGYPTVNPYLYGMPVLYPANRIFAGEFIFEGRKYKFPINEPQTDCHIHGFLHETEFETTQIEENHIKCVFEKPYLDFCHKFRLEITYNLSENGLEQVTKITNLSGENMPNFLAFHTTFNIPFIKNSDSKKIRVYAETKGEIERDENYLPTGIINSKNDVLMKMNSGEFMPFEKKISIHTEAAGDGKIEIRDFEKNIALIYENDKKFSHRLFYNGDADAYICLEPMNCGVNCPNSPLGRSAAGFDVIRANSSKEYISKIYLKKF